MQSDVLNQQCRWQRICSTLNRVLQSNTDEAVNCKSSILQAQSMRVRRIDEPMNFTFKDINIV